MDGYLRQSTASQVMTIGAFVDDTDFKTLENALTINNTDIKIKKNGAASGNKNSGGATADGSAGLYHLTWDATDSNTVGQLFYSVKVAGALVVFGSYQVLEEAAYDAMFASSADPKADINVASIDAGAITAAAIADGAIDAATFAAGAITATVIATGAIDADALATDAVAEIADGVWDEDATGHQTLGTFGQAIGDPVADTNTIYKAVVTDAAGATVGVDVVAVKAETASIQTDTNDIQTRLPAALTAGGNIKTDDLYAMGRVWIDTGSGAAGTTSYVHGTLTNPNSSMANSRTIANNLNLTAFQIRNGSSVTLDQGYSGFSFVGEKWTLALANRLITNSHFSGADVSGLSSGTGAEFDDCLIGTVTIADASKFSRCALTGTFTCGAAGNYIFDACFSGTTAGVDAVVDFGALGATTVAFRNYNGGIEVRNMAAGDTFAFTGAGRVTIAASCTAGTVLISGPNNFVNNGSGQTISDTSRWNEDQNITNVTGNVTGSVGSVAAGGITATSIATDAIDADALAADAITEIQAGLATAAALATVQADTDNIQTRLPAALLNGRMESNVAAISDDATAADNLETMLDGTGGQVLSLKQLNIVNSTGSALVASSTGSNGHGIAASGNGSGDGISATGGATGHGAECVGGFTSGDGIHISATDGDGIEAIGAGVGNADIKADIEGSLSGSVGSVAAGGITAASIATDAIDADALATDAVAEIADGVWDEALAGHLGAGSTGAALNAAGAAGDPWSTAIPGLYAAGTAGFIVGTNVDTTVSSRATAAGLATVQADTDDIQTRLPAALVAGRMDASVGAMAAGVVTAAAVATDAIDADAIAADAVTELADGLLKRDMGAVTGEAARSPLNALRLNRNKWSIAGGTLTVTKEDDATPAWTADTTTTPGDPITTVDPT